MLATHSTNTLATCDKEDYDIVMTKTFRILTILVHSLFIAAYPFTTITNIISVLCGRRPM